jgi:hypothetical protein
MASRSSNIRAWGELVVRLARLPIAMVGGKDPRRRAIAVTRVRPNHDLESTTHWHARHNPASNRRVE